MNNDIQTKKYETDASQSLPSNLKPNSDHIKLPIINKRTKNRGKSVRVAKKKSRYYFNILDRLFWIVASHQEYFYRHTIVS